MLRIPGLMFDGSTSIWLGMSGSIHLLPPCLHGIDRNIIYIINISNILGYDLLCWCFVMLIYSASSD
jgi:hypothetical protein